MTAESATTRSWSRCAAACASCSCGRAQRGRGDLEARQGGGEGQDNRPWHCSSPARPFPATQPTCSCASCSARCSSCSSASAFSAFAAARCAPSAAHCSASLLSPSSAARASAAASASLSCWWRRSAASRISYAACGGGAARFSICWHEWQRVHSAGCAHTDHQQARQAATPGGLHTCLAVFCSSLASFTSSLAAFRISLSSASRPWRAASSLGWGRAAGRGCGCEGTACTARPVESGRWLALLPPPPPARHPSIHPAVRWRQARELTCGPRRAGARARPPPAPAHGAGGWPRPYAGPARPVGARGGWV